MYAKTVDETIKRLQELIDNGTWRGSDIIAMRYWSFSDVVLEGSYINDVPIDNEMAREVWANVVEVIKDYDYVDDDVIETEISNQFREMFDEEDYQ